MYRNRWEYRHFVLVYDFISISIYFIDTYTYFVDFFDFFVLGGLYNTILFCSNQ